MRTLLLMLSILSISNFAYSNEKLPCGLTGSVEKRIADCDSSKRGFVLVSRTNDFKEVYQDLKTGLLWSDRLPMKMNYYDALKACLSENIGITHNVWRLPTLKDYETADSNGIRTALPNMKYWFWSSTSVHGDVYAGQAWSYAGFDNSYEGDFLNRRGDSAHSVRCVAW